MIDAIRVGGAVLADAQVDNDTLDVLGHELRRDRLVRADGLLAMWWCAVGLMHSIVVSRYVDQWRVTLMRHSAQLASATGCGADLDEAIGRMLVCAHRERAALGVEAVLMLAVVHRMPRPAPVPRDVLSIEHGCEPSADAVASRECETVRAKAVAS